MPTTGTVPGNLILISVGGTAIACSTSATIDMSTEVTDSTCKDNDGARQIQPGQKSWNMSLDGMLAFDSSYGWVDLVTAWDAKSVLTVRWGTGVTGDPYYEGDAFITSLSGNGPLNEASNYSVTFEGSGPLTIGTET